MRTPVGHESAKGKRNTVHDCQEKEVAASGR